MENIVIHYLSREPHLSQILTGYKALYSNDSIVFEDHSSDNVYTHKGPFVVAIYKDKRIVYDLQDGYQFPQSMEYHLEHCDYYFKRSFSEIKNRMLGFSWEGKMFPLGFNYHVSCKRHPLDKPFWKEEIKRLVGIEHNMWSCTYYTPEKFESIPRRCQKPRVLFMTRLWKEDINLPSEVLEERRKINQMRIDIIRMLRKMEDEIHFVGGLPDTDLAQNMAPDLIMASKLTDRRNYIKCLRKSDICIGSMGLFESIGWKTGEYVAAAKAIVNERFHYSVPGDFSIGKNYFDFDSAEQCIKIIRSLSANPDQIMMMKIANRDYYQKYLRPDRLIRNTLDLVDENSN